VGFHNGIFTPENGKSERSSGVLYPFSLNKIKKNKPIEDMESIISQRKWINGALWEYASKRRIVNI